MDATPTTPSSTAARREVVVDAPDGRRIAVTDAGPEDGPVVVHLHAAPGSRQFDPDPSATAAAGVRLLTIDRPGYGDSTPIAAGRVPTVAALAEDVRVVLDRLGIDEAAVVGWSAGGRIALAVAAAHPERVRAVAVVGTPAPDDEVPWVAPEHRALSESLRADPPSAVATIVEVFSAGAGEPGDDAGEDPSATASDAAGTGDPIEMLTRGGGADAALLQERPDVADRLRGMLGASFAQGPIGVATDIVADQVAPWGFDVAAVGAPVTLVYGDADAVVTPEHGRWYADRLSDGHLEVVPDAGHLVVVTRWAAILDSLTGPR